MPRGHGLIPDFSGYLKAKQRAFKGATDSGTAVIL
jgi:hypothetical protein